MPLLPETKQPGEDISKYKVTWYCLYFFNYMVDLSFSGRNIYIIGAMGLGALFLGWSLELARRRSFFQSHEGIPQIVDELNGWSSLERFVSGKFPMKC